MAEKRTLNMADQALYHKVLLIFSVAQWIAAMVLYGLTAINQSVLTVLLVLGIVGAVMAQWGFEKRFGRVCTRILLYLVSIGFLLAAGVVAILSIEPMASANREQAVEWWLQYGKNALAIEHTILLFLTPAMVLAARKGGRPDANFLRITGVLNTVMAAVLYLVPAVYDRLEVGVDNLYFRLFCLLCLAVTMVAAFLIPPQWSFGKRKDKER